MQGQALLLQLVKVVIVPVNAGLAVSEHLLNVVLVLFAVGAAWVCDAALLALLPGILNLACGGELEYLNVCDELLEDGNPLLETLVSDTDLDFFGAACSLVAKLREGVFSLEPCDCFSVNFLVPALVGRLD